MAPLAFLLKDGPPRRIACVNSATYTFLWPALFTGSVPAARPLCRWAARRGAAVHGGLRLRQRDGPRCELVAVRGLAAGTALVSLPLSLSLSTAGCVGGRRGTFEGAWAPLEELTGLVVRHLHNPRSPHRRYLELLHDLHNMDADEGEGLDYIGGAGPSDRLRAQLDELYGGNAMHARGVENAPFLDKSALQSAEARVRWVRTQAMLRRVEQSVPHFAAKSAAWGASMVLARAIPDDAEGLSLYPIIDFCAHSYEPNTVLRVCTTAAENRSVGVKWHDGSSACVHLVARRAIRRGEVLTRLYSPRPAKTREDAEFWQMQWGFVPT